MVMLTISIPPSKISAGFASFGMRSTSFFSTEAPTKPPAVICAATRAAEGMTASSVVRFSATAPTSAPTIIPPGIFSL